MEAIVKYPRTHHLEGSRLQPGDEGMGDVPFTQITDRPVVVEEKVDGSNTGIRFGPGREVKLQSRGHYLTGGGRERHFALFKQWAWAHAADLWSILGTRYIMYGEWLYAKHTVFYDALPHYFMEFDLLDTTTGHFLDTPTRHRLLEGSPVVSVPILTTEPLSNRDTMAAMVGPSLYKGPRWQETFEHICAERSLDVERAWGQTDRSDHMEGLYLKVEEGGRVVERYKFVRYSFTTAIADSDSHWLERPIIPNQLAEGVSLFS
ncbi:MAG: RNA ligase family protein [Myxococcota bacterium]